MNSDEVQSTFAQLDAALKKFKIEWADEAFTRIVQRTPVDTGALKADWKQEQRTGGFDIWNTQGYATYIEQGTPKMAPVGMIATTILEKNQISELAKQRSNIK